MKKVALFALVVILGVSALLVAESEDAFDDYVLEMTKWQERASDITSKVGAGEMTIDQAYLEFLGLAVLAESTYFEAACMCETEDDAKKLLVMAGTPYALYLAAFAFRDADADLITAHIQVNYLMTWLVGEYFSE
jgi:hypothetical protein